MVAVVEGRGPEEVWREAAKLILTSGEQYPLIAEIREPLDFNFDDLRKYDPRRVQGQLSSLSDTVNTIFPQPIWIGSSSREEFYRKYRQRHDRAKRLSSRTRHRWGAYFDRFINFGEDSLNQLELIVAKMNEWTNTQKSTFTMHTTHNAMDTPAPLGNPCLQYIEFLSPTQGQIDLLAVYRNHDYFSKALGNFIGLAYLAKFVADETGNGVGKLTCVSARASCGTAKRNLRDLLEQ